MPLHLKLGLTCNPGLPMHTDNVSSTKTPSRNAQNLSITLLLQHKDDLRLYINVLHHSLKSGLTGPAIISHVQLLDTLFM